MNMQSAIVPAAADELPLMLPTRPAMRYDFGRAWRHFKNLVKDKENTAEVAPIFESLPWTGAYEAAKKFLTSDRGKAIYASEPCLVEILDDHEALRKLPAGSLAHVYCDFMEREGLSAQGLVDELNRYRPADMYFNDQVDWYFRRMRDTHDLLHVLTGFGRDALGAGLDRKGFLGAGQAGEVEQHRHRPLCSLRRRKHRKAHRHTGFAGVVPVKALAATKAGVLGKGFEGHGRGTVRGDGSGGRARRAQPFPLLLAGLINTAPPSGSIRPSSSDRNRR